MTESLPELRQFILPAGSELATRLHLARTVARRAERAMVQYQASGHVLPEHAVPFINRVSDFLFVAARYANGSEPETVWKKSIPP